MPFAFDNPDQADAPEMVDTQAQVAAPVPVSGAGGMNFDNPDNPDAPEFTDAKITAAPASAGILIGPFPVSYAPDPNAAFTVTPGTKAADGTFVSGGVTYGSYPAMATLAGGSYNLAGTATDPLLPGEVSLQPGDWSGGVFSPVGPPITGELNIAGALGGDVLPDVSITAGAPLAGFGGQRFSAGSSGYIHVKISAVLNADGSDFDLTPYPVALAVTFAGPQASDFQDGDWLTVTAPPDIAGDYARLRVSAAAGNLLAGVSYFVYVRIGDQVVCASEILTVTYPHP